jgi:hypothetical protein
MAGQLEDIWWDNPGILFFKDDNMICEIDIGEIYSRKNVPSRPTGSSDSLVRI